MVNFQGYMFISYRSTQSPIILRITQRLREYGIPVWHDKTDMPPGMLEQSMTEAIRSEDCSGALVWLSKDVESSVAMQQIELPEIFDRVRRTENFLPVFCLADGLAFDDAQNAISSSYSNVNLKSYLLQPFGDQNKEPEDIEHLAQTVLSRRIELLHSVLPEGENLRIHIAGHAEPIESTEHALIIDYHPLFDGRFAADSDWILRILPALDSIAGAFAQYAPGRGVIADGSPQLSLALAFGYALRTPRGVQASWLQSNPHSTSQPWAIDSSQVDHDFRFDHDVDRLRGQDIAVIIGVTHNPQPTFNASAQTLPQFGAVIRVTPLSEEYPAEISSSSKGSSLSKAIVSEIRAVIYQYSLQGSVHLFLAGPAGLAFLLGQQLNTFGTVFFYEHEPTGPIGTYRQGLKFDA